MMRKSIFNAFLMLIAVGVLVGGGLAQGKHGGKKHGGHGDGRGKEFRQQRDDDDRGKGENRARGRQKGDDDKRSFKKQTRREERESNWVFVQQRQNEKFARKQQKQVDRDVRRQQADIARQQRYRQQIYLPQYEFRNDRRQHDNGLHLGWYKNGKAFNNGRPWRSRDDDRDQRKANKRDRRVSLGYVYDPIVTYLPAYQQPYYVGTSREHFVRSLIAGFFAQGPVYDSYRAYEVYEVRQPAYVYQQPYRYSNAGYSPVYYDEPYYNDEPYYSDYDALGGLGGGGLKSGLLNLGLELLQGFLGTGYSQGLYDGAYARDVYGPRYVNADYTPYDAPPAYYSPYVSSLADQRQLFEEGYRLGYQDAMRDRNAYATFDSVNTGDLVTEFLAATLIDRL